ncbi:hypothetical protein ES703_123248 [subsurface metagenome]
MKRIGFIDGRRIAGWSFPATATPGNGQVITINDPSIIAGGTITGRRIVYNATGDKTGAPTVTPDTVDFNISGNCEAAYGRSTYIGMSGDPTITYLAGHFIYMDDIGAAATIAYMCALHLGVNVTNAPTTGSTFMRAYSHGGAVQSFAWFPSANGITNLFHFEQHVAPIGVQTAGAAAITNWCPIAVRLGAGTRYMIMGDIA